LSSLAFQGCRKLSKIELPEGLVEIGEFVFPRLPLTELYLPSTVAAVGSGAFAALVDLTGFKVSPANQFFANDEDGLLWSKNRTVLIAFPLARPGRYLELPNTTLEIAPFAVGWHPELSRLVLTSVVSISPFAFLMCNLLWEVVLPTTLKRIGSGAFGDCIVLSRIVLPDSLEVVEPFAFRGCSSLTALVFPPGVTEIGEGCFKDTGVRAVSVYGNIANISAKAFSGTQNLTSIVINGDFQDSICPTLYDVPVTVKVFLNASSAPKVVCGNVTVSVEEGNGLPTEDL
jgi:hypothetical protein